MKDTHNGWLEDAYKGKTFRQILYLIIFESDTKLGKAFDITLLIFILASIVNVLLESMNAYSHEHVYMLRIFEYIITVSFTIEYLLRIYCSPRPRKYIFSFMGIVDLLAVLPVYLSMFIPGISYLLVMRAFRLIRIFRIFNLFKFQNQGNIILRSLKMSLPKIIVFFLFILILVVSIGTLMYIVEGRQPNSDFKNIPISIYWAIVTLTTVGYGDIAPVTTLGRMIAALVMLIGYTIIAVPTGIVAVSLAKQDSDNTTCPNCHAVIKDQKARFCPQCGADMSKTPLRN